MFAIDVWERFGQKTLSFKPEITMDSKGSDDGRCG